MAGSRSVVVLFMLSSRIDRFARIAELFDAAPSLPRGKKADMAPELIITHRKKVGFPKGLSEICNIGEKDIRQMAETIVDHPVKHRNPRQMSLEDCVEIYQRIL